jgi:hypothetical protein
MIVSTTACLPFLSFIASTTVSTCWSSRAHITSFEFTKHLKCVSSIQQRRILSMVLATSVRVLRLVLVIADATSEAFLIVASDSRA